MIILEELARRGKDTARRVATLEAQEVTVVGSGTTVPAPNAQNQMIISNAALVWSLLAAPTAQYQVPIAGADPYTPAWAALTVAAISDLAYATPALTLSTANAEGAADTVIRSDATILVFDVTVPTTIQPDDVAATGSAGVAAQRDHKHGIVCGAPASPSVSLAASTEGSGTPFARAGHTHQLDQAIVPTWTGLHTFNASVIVYRSSQAISAYRTHVTGEAHHRFYITTGGALYWGSGGAAPDVILYRSAANTLRLEDTLAVNIGITLAGGTGVNAITIPDNVAQAVHLVDVGGIEYWRVVSTDAQPVVVFNEAGADVDFQVEASGQANAVFVRGSDGKIGFWTTTLDARINIGGTPGPAMLNLPTNLSTIDAGLSSRDVANEAIIIFGNNVHSSYTGRTVVAEAGAAVRLDTRDQDNGYTVFHVLVRAAGAAENSYTIPFQIAGGAPSGSLHISRAGDIGIGTGTPTDVVDIDLPVAGSSGGLSLRDTHLFARLYDSTGGADTGTLDLLLGGVLKVKLNSNGNSYLIGGNFGIGTATPATSALLELLSTTGALLLTRMTTAQRDALTAVNGMVVYNTTTTAFNFYENGSWVTK